MVTPPAAMASAIARFGTGRSRKAPRTETGSDDEEPSNREIMQCLKTMQAALTAVGDVVGGLEAKLEARLVHFEEHVLAQHRADVLREVDQRLRGMAEHFDNKLAQLAASTERHDRAARAANLVVHGLSEEPREDPVGRAVGLFPVAEGPAAPLLDARRLGAPGPPGRSRPRPLLINFASVSAKHAALKHSKVLRSRQVYLDEDLTPAQRAARTALRPRYMTAKAAGHQPFWRGERLFVRVGGRVGEVLSEARPPSGAPAPGTAPASGGPAPSGAGPSRATGVRRSTAPTPGGPGPTGTGPSGTSAAPACAIPVSGTSPSSGRAGPLVTVGLADMMTT